MALHASTASRFPATHAVDALRLRDLLLQAHEAEHGNAQVLASALRCATHGDLARRWRDMLERARRRERALMLVLQQLDLGLRSETSGRRIAANLTSALLAAMREAQETGDATAAQVVAAACVEHAAIRVHRVWELIGHLAHASPDETGRTLDSAFDSAPRDDGELYGSRGWVRELWIDALGLPAVLPPPGRPMPPLDTAVPRLPWRSRERAEP